MGFFDEVKKGVSEFPKKFVDVAAPGLRKGASKLQRELEGEQVTQEQVALETPEERAARRLRLKFAETGQIGDITAGEELGLPLGVFDPTDIETTALDRVRALLGAGGPEELDLGTSAIKRLLAATETDIGEQFDPFKARTLREVQEAEDRLKRGAAFTGSLFGTQAIRGLGDIQARGSEVLAGKLAELVDRERQRRTETTLATIPLASEIARTREDIELGRIGTGASLGGLERLLESARQDAERQEVLRRRGEVFSQLDVAGGITSPEFGIPSVTTRVPSPFENLINIVANVGGQVAAARAGRPSVGAG